MPSYENPREAGKEAAWIDKKNQLAHTIRKLEQCVTKMRRRPFVIRVKNDAPEGMTRVDFNGKWNYADIFLDTATEHLENVKFRLTLAHEIGHIYFNYDALRGAEFTFSSFDATIGEEVYAWAFAFWLVFEKGEMFRERGGDPTCIYAKDDLKTALKYLILDSRKPNKEDLWGKLDGKLRELDCQ